jgi:hypothetical protein
MKPNPTPDVKDITRRYFFQQACGAAAGISVGSIALASLLQEGVHAQAAGSVVTLPPKAKRIVYLQMAGGAPHVDLFDYKPHLSQYDGIDAPDSLYKGERFAFITGRPRWVDRRSRSSSMGSPARGFPRYCPTSRSLLTTSPS